MVRVIFGEAMQPKGHDEAMGRKDNEGEPTLGEAWRMLGEQLGLTVEERGERSIRATGVVRGRGITVEIECKNARSEFWRFLANVNTISSRNRRDEWHTAIAVACVNPSGATGSITSAVDTNDPAWNPREYNPRNGRWVVANPPALGQRALTADTHERLMSIMDDLRIDVHPQSIVIEEHSTSRPDSGAGYVAGSFLHHYQGSPPPMPQRAIAGPPWWIDLLCEIADTLDR